MKDSVAPPNSTAGDAVYRADGTRLYGLDAELERKAQAKRDPAFEKKLLKWVEETTGSNSEHPDDLAESLKSGVLLCRLINVVEPGSIKKIDTRPIALVYVENINNYLKACYKIGVPSSDLFINSDLFMKKGIPQVIQNVHAVARLAQSQPNWKGPVVDSVPKPGKVAYEEKPRAKKWEVKDRPLYTTVEDFEKESEQRRYEEAGDVAKELLARLNDEENIRKKLEEELRQLKHRLEVLQQDNSHLSKRDKQLEEENNQLRKTANAPKISSGGDAQLKRNNEVAATNQVELQMENERLKRQLKDLQTSNQPLPLKEKELKDLKQQLEDVKKERDRYKSDSDQLKRQVTDLKTSAPSPGSTPGSPDRERALQSTIEELKSSLQQEKDTKSTLQRQLKEVMDLYQSETASKNEWKSIYRAMTLRVRSADNVPERQSNRDVAGGLDADLVQFLEETLNNLLGGTKTEEVHRLNALFKTELGRRHFVKVVRRMMKAITSLVLTQDAFEVLLYLVNLCIHEIDMSPSKDYFTAKKILKASTRLISDSSEFIKDYIKDHKIWKELNFWEEYFLDELFRKYRKYFPEETRVDADFLTTLCSSFVLNMQQWDLELPQIKAFVKQVLSSEAVGVRHDPAQATEMEALLLGFVDERENTAKQDRSLSLSSSGSSDSDKKRKSFIKKKKDQESSAIPAGPVLKQGYLLKKGNKRRNWTLRWFILKQKFLIYMKSPKDKNPQGVIDLSKCTTRTSDRKPFCFVVSLLSLVSSDFIEYHIRGKNEEERQEWMKSIGECLTPALRGSQNEKADSSTLRASQNEKLEEKKSSFNENLSTSSEKMLTPRSSASSSSPRMPDKIPSSPRVADKLPQTQASPTTLKRVESPKKSKRMSVSLEKMEKKEKGTKSSKLLANAVANMAVAIADFQGADSKELSFRAGDMIKIEKQDGSGWWRGEMDGKKGWVPKDFVRIMSSPTSRANTAKESKLSVGEISKDKSKLPERVKATYDWEAMQSNELSFKEGNIIVVLERYKNSEWMKGQVEGTTKVGLFPSNYTEPMK